MSRPPANIYLTPSQKRKARKCTTEVSAVETKPTDSEIEAGFAKGIELCQFERWFWFFEKEFDHFYGPRK